MKNIFVLTSTIAFAIVVLTWTAFAQIGVPSWIGHLVMGYSQTMADPTLTAPEAQGLGLKFELLFAMTNDQDPQNSDNDVISVVTTTAYPAGVGVAVRDMLPQVKIATLTNQISLKYLFTTGRTCSGGSPRIQLYIDPGDGTSPHNAFGYVGNGGFGTGCISDANWHFQDMTDDVPFRWDITQFGGGYQNWGGVVTFFNTTYPNHKVLSGGLYDDSCSFASTACGKAYYDLLTIENRTLENRQDTVQGPKQ
jgi:hypothetical protein